MAANDKKTTIVIKKINVVAAGHHGGSWKVAFADFMTAMMAFFLVMWLIGQSDEVKKSVADYFSSPSIIEYNFSNYGAELTLEKLFLDLVNEPLKAFEQFITPVDKKPNLMDMGTKRIQIHFLAEKLGEVAKNINITSDEITFEIPEEYLFRSKTSEPAGEYAQIMERVRGLIEGLKDTDVYVNSELPYRTNSEGVRSKNIAEARLDLVLHKIQQSITHESVDLFGKTTVEKISNLEAQRDSRGYIKFRIRQKSKPEDIKKSQEATTVYDSPAGVEESYDNFMNQIYNSVDGQSKSN